MRKISEFLRRVREWVRVDGLLHIETSALLVMFLAGFLPVPGAAMLTLFVGIGKEFYDLFRHDGNPGWDHDLLCDLIGIALGVVLLIPWHALAAWS